MSGTPTPPPLVVHVWSDVACPWCYIGKRRFEAGLATFAAQPGSPPVTVEYHSYQLTPDTPVDVAGSERDFLVGYKQLAPAQVDQMIDHVARTARSVGLHYDFDALQHTNTGLAHQLLHHAKAHGRQAEVKERLLSAYFVEGRHVGRVDELADLAAEVGLDREAARQALLDGRHQADVAADQRAAAELGVTGVPFYVVGGRYGLAGAHPPEDFAEALRLAAADAAQEAGTGT